MNERPIIEEQYKRGKDVINYVVYKSRLFMDSRLIEGDGGP